MAELGFRHRYGRLQNLCLKSDTADSIPVSLIIHSVLLGKLPKHTEFHFYTCTLEIIKLHR